MLIEIKNRYTGAVIFTNTQDCNTIGATIKLAIKSKTSLSRANLKEANLKEANLSEANLSGANLSEANLSWANLSEANLSEANLSGASLRGATLRWANLSGASLSDADLSGANLGGANLRWADLRWANLSGADLGDADLSWANLSEANLSEAYLHGTIGNMGEIVSVIVDTYPVAMTKDIIQIGCKRYPYKQWKEFDDFAIMEMDGVSAKAFWDKWKDIILETYLLKFGEK